MRNLLIYTLHKLVLGLWNRAPKSGRVTSSADENKTNLRGLGPRANYAERQPLGGEVSTNFLRIEGAAWSARRIRFPALPDFLRNNGSETGFTQPREYNLGATWKKK
jgi:hypothetical protein